MRRYRNGKIVATLGPSSGDAQAIRALFHAGVDLFRLNFSHGSHHEHEQRYGIIRALEEEVGRPIGIMVDLQGPKLRLGAFEGGGIDLAAGAHFRLDLTPAEGDCHRGSLPHREVFEALQSGTDILIDDGRVRLHVEASGPDFAETTVLVGGRIADHKGVNLPGMVLPMSPLTPKDHDDLRFAM
jgi:pyruvate kinase